ncbi:hypothetical protein F4818DRAFT_237359 [Hypoxylon cercidicola]|nr:hypothetical protein F4818DRAFT_237359 [Hypoxylon cercidicola]
MSSLPNKSGSERPTASVGMGWDDLSAEHKMQWLLNNAGDTKWGWVVYRSCYKPEFDSTWDNVKSVAEETARQRVAASDAPDVADKMDWVFVEDRENLDGASREELKRRFRDWVRAENPGRNIDEEKYGRASRYTFFVQVDGPSLRGIPTGDGHPYVSLVQSWEGEADTSEDWMKIQTNALNLGFYVELNNDETWYTVYMTSDGICSWYE